MHNRHNVYNSIQWKKFIVCFKKDNEFNRRDNEHNSNDRYRFEKEKYDRLLYKLSKRENELVYLRERVYKGEQEKG